MAVLAVLAALQYRWLGQVSLAERQRMHETMTARARSLANDIDRELSRLYLTFQIRDRDPSQFEALVAERYTFWRAGTRHPDLIEGLYTVSADGGLRKFEPADGTLHPVAWPDTLASIRERTFSSRLMSDAGGQNTFTIRMPPTVST